VLIIRRATSQTTTPIPQDNDANDPLSDLLDHEKNRTVDLEMNFSLATMADTTGNLLNSSPVTLVQVDDLGDANFWIRT